ncbi:hypothetical protein [Fusobacterium ulcerans]|uniref:hypothetical protein n=1 Tax=Fusobacterium TaxID=848 RepID=UPI00155930F7|nr:hypothetical protein [Fusobacterium ulcerans]
MKELIYKVEITLVATDTGMSAAASANFDLDPILADEINRKIAHYICNGPDNKSIN